MIDFDHKDVISMDLWSKH